MNQELIQQLIKETKHKQQHIENVLNLLHSQNTVPFIARYRKEMTGGMNEEDIKKISDEYQYLVSLEKRKNEVIRLIDEQGLLTEELRADIQRQTVLNRVEDLYRPFKQKKKTRATEAKRKGLEPLADLIYAQATQNIKDKAAHYINEEVESVDDALSGALDIIAEKVSDEPKYRKYIFKVVSEDGLIESKVKKNAEDEEGIFEMYYDYSEQVKKVVPHRVLAMNRGEKLNILNIKVRVDEERLKRYILNQIIISQSQTRDYIDVAVQDALKRLILPSIEREIRANLTEKSEAHAVHIFEENLEQLLLQAPLKGKVILGVDPAFRTGCKLAVIDESGKFLDKGVIYPHPPQSKRPEALQTIKTIVQKYNVELIAIGNGTASRETEVFIADVIQSEQLDAQFLIVNEAGASVYSASAIAREEFPDFNVEERSAVSIARRVQDPLSELVKINPKSIGVGQYQHDVNQNYLNDALRFVVETSVNKVGVNVNTASHTLLEYVAGLSPSISKNIVKYREDNEGFNNRSDIKKVPRLGEKTYEQCIGFLRIPNGNEVLDQTPIHPEQYDNTYQLLSELGCSSEDVGTDKLKEKLNAINIQDVAKRLNIGAPTLEDIIEALKAPSRDIRDDYETPMLKSDVLKIEDLKPGMKLKGTVRNVIDFGAFVDIGVKQDGLVHISKLSNRFIKHPLEAVSIGDIVEVTVLDIDTTKNRIALSMKDE